MGVTTFFVISGYLICGLLVAEFEGTGTISLKQFWLRRVRRIVPAVLLAIAGTLVLCALFSPSLFNKARADLIPSLLFYNNWWQVFRDVSYFEAASAPSPFTHFWSLAIEEQFYIVMPLVLLALFKLRVPKKAIAVVIAVFAIASGVEMAVLYDPLADPSRIYYGTDTRAVSLLIGALLAFVWPSTIFGRRRLQSRSAGRRLAFNVVGTVALVALVAIIALTNSYTAFPYYGGIVLVSVLTAVLIAVLVVPNTWMARLLQLEPFVWIGKRSYGMYLWHYPIILTPASMTSTIQIPWWVRLAQLVIIIAVSDLSYRFGEAPIRAGALGAWWRARKAQRAAGAQGVAAGAQRSAGAVEQGAMQAQGTVDVVAQDEVGQGLRDATKSRIGGELAEDAHDVSQAVSQVPLHARGKSEEGLSAKRAAHAKRTASETPRPSVKHSNSTHRQSAGARKARFVATAGVCATLTVAAIAALAIVPPASSTLPAEAALNAQESERSDSQLSARSTSDGSVSQSSLAATSSPASSGSAVSDGVSASSGSAALVASSGASSAAAENDAVAQSDAAQKSDGAAQSNSAAAGEKSSKDAARSGASSQASSSASASAVASTSASAAASPSSLTTADDRASSSAASESASKSSSAASSTSGSSQSPDASPSNASAKSSGAKGVSKESKASESADAAQKSGAASQASSEFEAASKSGSSSKSSESADSEASAVSKDVAKSNAASQSSEAVGLNAGAEASAGSSAASQQAAPSASADSAPKSEEASGASGESDAGEAKPGAVEAACSAVEEKAGQLTEKQRKKARSELRGTVEKAVIRVNKEIDKAFKEEQRKLDQEAYDEIFLTEHLNDRGGIMYDPVLIGDSVAAGCENEFYKTFPNGHSDAIVNRNIWESPYGYYCSEDLAGTYVVFCLGTNNAVVDEQIDELIATVPEGKRVILVNIRCPRDWEAQTNEAIANAPSRHPNIVSIVDWYGLSAGHDEFFYEDGIHLNEVGAKAYISFIQQAIEADVFSRQ